MRQIFDTWITIVIPLIDPREGIIEVLRKNKVSVLSDKIHGVIEWLKNAGRSTVPRKLKLVRVTPQELGFSTEEISRFDVYKCALHVHKLHYLNGEEALELRVQYADQPKGELIYIAIRTIEINGHPYIVQLDFRNDHPRISVIVCKEDYMFKSGDVIIFGQSTDQYD